jgi:ABC-type branched-subunit amino acid transport system substrate-binding protein
MFPFLPRLRKLIAPAALFLGLTGLSACQELAGGGPIVSAQAPIPVALLVPGGSGSATDEALARNLERAARMAVGDLQGVKIDLRVYNTRASANGAAAAADKAIKEGAKAIVGPVYAQAANAAGKVAAPHNINVLAFSNNAAIAGGNVLILGSTFDNTAERLMRFANGQGKRKVMIVHGNDPAGVAGKDAIEKAITSTGATLAGVVGYDLNQQSIVNALPVASKTARSTGANAVFLTATPDADLPFLAQLLPENGVKPSEVQYMGLSRWDARPQIFLQDGIQGGWFALPDPTVYPAFQKRYEAAYGAQPHPLAGLAYDGIAAIGALARAGRNDALTKTALTQGAGFRGAYGTFRLRLDGTNQRALAVARIQGNQVEVISPAPQRFGLGGS